MSVPFVLNVSSHLCLSPEIFFCLIHNELITRGYPHAMWLNAQHPLLCVPTHVHPDKQDGRLRPPTVKSSVPSRHQITYIYIYIISHFKLFVHF